MTLTAEPPVAADIDPRDPELRLSKLLDAGSMHELHERDNSGVYAVRGTIEGAPVTFRYDASTSSSTRSTRRCASGSR